MGDGGDDVVGPDGGVAGQWDLDQPSFGMGLGKWVGCQDQGIEPMPMANSGLGRLRKGDLDVFS